MEPLSTASKPVAVQRMTSCIKAVTISGNYIREIILSTELFFEIKKRILNPIEL